MEQKDIDALLERMKRKNKDTTERRAEMKMAHNQVESLYRLLREQYPQVSNAQIFEEIAATVGYSSTNIRWILGRRGVYQPKKRTAKKPVKPYRKTKE